MIVDMEVFTNIKYYCPPYRPWQAGKVGLGAAGAYSGFLAAAGFQNSIDKVINDVVCGNQHSLGHNAHCSLWFGSLPKRKSGYFFYFVI
jgi:hypothetical protein